MRSDESPEEMMEASGLLTPSTPPLEKSTGRRVKKSLVGGEVGEVELKPETVSQPKSKLMKVVTITRTSEGRIANIELRVKDGTLYDLEIDEATANAIASVFRDQ